MGYRTFYTLNIEPKPSEELLNYEFEDGFTIGELLENNLEDMRWYEHEKDMVKLSSLFPEYLFTLDGEGEESADIWRKFFKNNKTYSWYLDYELPEFDENKLQ